MSAIPMEKRRKRPPYFKDFKSPSAIVQWSNIDRYLKPGESVTDAIVLTKLYVLKSPAKYRVWISRFIPDLDGVMVKFNEITITIVK